MESVPYDKRKGKIEYNNTVEVVPADSYGSNSAVIEPISTALRLDSLPLKFPIGVLLAQTITTLFNIFKVNKLNTN